MAERTARLFAHWHRIGFVHGARVLGVLLNIGFVHGARVVGVLLNIGFVHGARVLGVLRSRQGTWLREWARTLCCRTESMRHALPAAHRLCAKPLPSHLPLFAAGVLNTDNMSILGDTIGERERAAGVQGWLAKPKDLPNEGSGITPL